MVGRHGCPPTKLHAHHARHNFPPSKPLSKTPLFRALRRLASRWHRHKAANGKATTFLTSETDIHKSQTDITSATDIFPQQSDRGREKIKSERNKTTRHLRFLLFPRPSTCDLTPRRTQDLTSRAGHIQINMPRISQDLCSTASTSRHNFLPKFAQKHERWHTFPKFPKFVSFQNHTANMTGLNQSAPSFPCQGGERSGEGQSGERSGERSGAGQDGAGDARVDGAKQAAVANSGVTEDKSIEIDDESHDKKADSDHDDDFMSDDEDDDINMEMDEHGQPVQAPKSPPKLPRKTDEGVGNKDPNKPEVSKKLSLQARLQATSARLRASVPTNMGGRNNEVLDPNNEGWTEVVGRSTKKTYTDVPVKPGDHFILCKGHNDNSAHLQEGLTDVVVFDIATCMLQTHVADLDMIVKAVTITETDTQLSVNAAKKRWAKAQNKGKAPIIKMRVFAIHIGLADDSEELGEDEEKLIIEILDDLFRRKAHQSLDSTSPWPPHLEQYLAPVLAMKPKPIAIIYGLNPTTHGADASTCNEINRHLCGAYRATMPGMHKGSSFLDWNKLYGVRATNFQETIRYHVYAADVVLKTTFHKSLKTGDNKIIKFLYGGLECVPRIIPEAQADTVALKNVLIEYVDNVQKHWKPLLLTGMTPGIEQLLN
eukprot:scaffold66527_cov60-Attheya_sp.AAC.1